ncbi:hypothetical protein Goari_022662 [Gossypium aridum]|uniref:NAC domain-containing protein n=1 Tax=Gossypium aridum TaxID=34290 RepID=A0A7J8YSN4_GOSAI|nr:hypothetical protein [Gossypium aridum]
MKKTLVFFRGKTPLGTRTDWIMHEYRLVTADTYNAPHKKNQTQNHVVAVENWVLCRIFLKKRSGGATKKEDGNLATRMELVKQGERALFSMNS